MLFPRCSSSVRVCGVILVHCPTELHNVAIECSFRNRAHGDTSIGVEHPVHLEEIDLVDGSLEMLIFLAGSNIVRDVEQEALGG